MTDAVVVELQLPFETADEPGYHVWIIPQGRPHRLLSSYPEAQARELAKTLNGILRCPVTIAPVGLSRRRRRSLRRRSSETAA